MKKLFILITLICLPVYSFAADDKEPYEYAIDLYGATHVRTAAREWFAQRSKADVVPALIRSLRYYPEDRNQTLLLLKTLTGENFGPRWFDWYIWMEQQDFEDIPKNELFISAVMSRIDPQFKVFFYPDIERKIRLAEITWGGVRKDGIPALTQPKFIDSADADYLTDREPVFGVSINGDTRAYPYRIMDWHEMFNDTIGGVNVSLAYCTLCGAGVLYKTDREAGKQPFVFGSSGFLYRSNKLMYDQETHSLWNQFSGKPVVGPLVNEDIELEVLPVVTTSWGEWRKQHPDTKVLTLETGFRRDYSPGAAYAAYFNSEDLMFPAAVTDDRLQQKDQVFGLRISGSRKAWPLSTFKTPRAINEQVGVIPVVIIGSEATRSVRAYRSEGKQFTLSEDNKVVANGQEWQLTESELIGPDGEKLPRLPGHLAYWFAWSNYFPATLEED